MGHWSGLRPVFCYSINTGPNTGAPLGCLVAVLCGGEPAVLELQDHPFHVLWQVIDGVDAGMGQLWT